MCFLYRISVAVQIVLLHSRPTRRDAVKAIPGRSALQSALAYRGAQKEAVLCGRDGDRWAELSMRGVSIRQNLGFDGLTAASVWGRGYTGDRVMLGAWPAESGCGGGGAVRARGGGAEAAATRARLGLGNLGAGRTRHPATGGAR
ncbi:hypothetical protein P7K49_039121 [Saguinus oedipus]|uniref:Uncharacterized protein n=1 Tax=Saguinus oedipus TaxID=9490 RepID=A0ABQ9TGK5_SAGOE|nr:hypothetical protein P7K49_039121 [Saguinus oedipus]